MSFSLTDFLSQETLKDSKRTEQTVSMIAADKLHPSDNNFYSMDDERIQKMAASILMLSTPEKIGIQQNLVVSPIPDTDEYTILTGETRWRAVMQLIDHGDLETDQIPCVIMADDDSIRNELVLILTNSTQRERSDAEKMHEIKRIRELLEEYKKNHKLNGTVQKAIGDLLGMSKTKVGTLENIGRNLSPELLEEYERGHINTSVANKLAGLDADGQHAGKEMLDKKGAITADDVKTLDHASEQKADFDIKIEVSDDPVSPDTEEDSIQFHIDLSGEKGNVPEDQEDGIPVYVKEDQEDGITEGKHRYHPELIDDLQEILRLGCISADTKAFVDAAAERVLKSYRTLNDNPVFNTPDPELILMVQDGTRVSLDTFVYDFYEEIVKMVLNVVDSSDFI